MILDSKCGLRGVLVNADTGEPIRWARWADTETGHYEAFRIDPKQARAAGIPLRSILMHGWANLRFVEQGNAAVAVRARPGSSTPLNEIRREVLKGRVVEAKPLLLIPGFPPPECDEPKCHRRAEWGVACEQEVEPEAGPDGKLYDRGIVTETFRYCSWCYRPPVTKSVRGVEREMEEVAARPQ